MLTFSSRVVPGGSWQWLYSAMLMAVQLALFCAARTGPAGEAATVSAPATTPAATAMARVIQTFDARVKPFLDTYCVGCHNAKTHKGDLDLSVYTSGSAALPRADIWKDCAKRMQAGEMPPEKERKQPSAEERAQILAWVRSLKQLSPKDPGRGVMRRLSQVEYANTLRDLLGVDPKVADQLPHDVVGEGFNSSISPLLMEKYLLVADEVLDQVIKPNQLLITWNAGQLDAIVGGKPDAGKPDGNERRLTGPSELITTLSAPVNGTYTIRLRAAAEKVAEKSVSKEPARLAVRIDGQVVGEVKVTAAPKTPGTYTVTCKLVAGKYHLSVLLVNPVVEVVANTAKKTAPPAPPAPPAPTERLPRTVIVDTIEVVGPPGALPTEIQRRLFVAMPGKDLSKLDAAKQIAESFARRAFRRPVTEHEIATLLSVFKLADDQDEVFTESVKLMLKAVLVSPAFLFITPDDVSVSVSVSVSGSAAGAKTDIVPLGQHQLASRLSYLFWATMPDDELNALANAGKLHDHAVITAQVQRLIADPRSSALFHSFGAPWLGVDKLDEHVVSEKKYPLLTKELRQAMYDEPAMLFDLILRENRSLIELIDANFTFMNGSLAKIYGMEATVKGAKMVRVPLSDPNRGGVLAMPGVLTVTSQASRTSPPQRGFWVLKQILGQAPPPPPMNVPALEQQDTTANSDLSQRQRMERHSTDPACVDCHRTLDPIGFGLENFDAIGRWRDKDDAGVTVDSSGELPGKLVFNSPQELKRVIANRKDEICRALVNKALAYALCRGLDGYDDVVADEIADAVAKDGYRFQTLWCKVATSYPFLHRRLSH